jgi:hypothetical protein
LLIAVVIGISVGGKPTAAKPLTAPAKLMAAETAWVHGDGDMLYLQFVVRKRSHRCVMMLG